MKLNLIIGAGELGSRHLQGLLKCNEAQHVFIMDTSDASLQKAAERASEVHHTHQVSYVNKWEDLPVAFDIVIVATTSAVRKLVVTDLLNRIKVEYLILEKVLFQDLAAYDEISKLIKEKEVKTWVNHPRRMYGHYKELAQQFATIGEPLNMHVSGGNWGLGCNALHMIDLVSYVNNSAVSKVSAGDIDNELIESKRPGYMEFTGTITGALENGAFFSITSFKGSRGALTLHFSSSTERYLFQEGGIAQQVKLSAADKYVATTQTIDSYYQSGLTQTLAEQLYATGDCELTPYESASTAHTHFIKALLKQYNQITQLNTDVCPIT